MATHEAEIAKEQAKGPAADRGLIRDHQLAIEDLRSAKRRKVFEELYSGDLRKDDDDIP